MSLKRESVMPAGLRIEPELFEFERETPEAARCRKKWEDFRNALTDDVKAALNHDFDLAVITAIHHGLRDVNKLTDMLFFQSWGQTRGYCRIRPGERDPSGRKKMADWWRELRAKHVVPAVKKPSPKLPRAGGIACVKPEKRPAPAAPEAPEVDLTGSYEQRLPGTAPPYVVRINQAGTHIECLIRQTSTPADKTPGRMNFLFGDRQEDGSYFLFNPALPGAFAVLKPAPAGILLSIGSGQWLLGLVDDNATHLVPTLGKFTDELVRLHQQRPLSHAQMEHLINGLTAKKIEPFLDDYFNKQSGDDLPAARGGRNRSRNRFDEYLKSVFEHPRLGFLKTDQQDKRLVSFYARTLLSEARWTKRYTMSHLDWIQRMHARAMRDRGSLIYGEEWLDLRPVGVEADGPKHVYKVEVKLKGGGFWIHGYIGTITFEKVSDDLPGTRWKKGVRWSFGCRIVGGQAGASLNFQQTGRAESQYEWLPQDIPGDIRVGQFGAEATYGPVTAGATGGFIHVEGSRQFPTLQVKFKDFDIDVKPPKRSRGKKKPMAMSLKIGPGGFFGSIRPKAFPLMDLSSPSENTDYAVALGLKEDVHFCLDSAFLTEDARHALRIMIGKELPAFLSPLSRIAITGHTDRSGPPRRSPDEKRQYNKELSELRAQNTCQAIRDIVGDDLAILSDREHLLITGKGQEEAEKDANAINPERRRVDVVLSSRLVLTMRADGRKP
jgi:flagellar motor protein MotB